MYRFFLNPGIESVYICMGVCIGGGGGGGGI